jgi:hypothetical protein
MNHRQKATSSSRGPNDVYPNFGVPTTIVARVSDPHHPETVGV